MVGRNHPAEEDTGGDLGLSTASTDLFEDMLPEVMIAASPPMPQDLRFSQRPVSPGSMSADQLAEAMHERRDTIRPSVQQQQRMATSSATLAGPSSSARSKGISTSMRLGEVGFSTPSKGLGIMGMDGGSNGVTSPGGDWSRLSAGEPTPRPSPSNRGSYTSLGVPGIGEASSPRGMFRRSTSHNAVSPSSSLHSLSVETPTDDFGPSAAGPSTGSKMPRSRTMLRMRRASRDNDEDANSDSDDHGSHAPSYAASPLNPSNPLPPSDSASTNHTVTPSSTSPHHLSPRPVHSHPPNSPFLPPSIASSMARYVSELVVCNFDLDRGPVVERRMAGRPWGKGEKANVAFSAFPDTSLFSEGSISYSFKIRKPLGEGANESGSGLGIVMENGVEGGVKNGSAPGTPKGKGSYFPTQTAEPDDMAGSSASSATGDTSSAASSADDNPPPPLPPKISLPATPSPIPSPNPSLGAPRSPQPPLTPSHSPSFYGPITDPETPLSLAKPPPSKTETADDYRIWEQRGREWLYGYVWFQQRKDRTIARGYMQRSLVLLTHLPWPGLFSEVLEKVAPIYFQHGYAALEAACHAFANWPDPQPGSVLQLPLLTELLTVRIPDGSEAAQVPQVLSQPLNTGIPPAIDILPSLAPVQPLRALEHMLPSLWHLWECMILGEPMLVIAPDPKTCSDIVWWLRDLMRPIPAASYDFRPYLHIHDLDFRLLVNSNKPQAGVVAGVTNPFFRNAASHWPNIISIGPNRLAARPAASAPSSPMPGTVPSFEGFLSKRKRHVSKDRVLLKRLEALAAAGNVDDPAGNEALRMHFMQLTEKMLAPVNRYIGTLVPPPGSNEGMRPFNLTAFLAHLKAHAPNPLQFRTKGLSGKSKSESDFYTAFCSSAGFAGWLQGKVNTLNVARMEAQQSALSSPPILLHGSSAQFPFFLNKGLATPGTPSRSSTETRDSTEDSYRSSMSSYGGSSPAHDRRAYFPSDRRGSDGAVLGIKNLRM